MRPAPGGVVARIGRLVDGLSVTLALLASALIVALMLAVVFDISRRQLTGRSIGGVLEYSEIVMVLIVYLGIGYGQLTRSHVWVDLFIARLSDRVRLQLDLFVLFVVAALFFWIAVQTAQAGLTSFERREVRTGLASAPVWPAKIAVSVGFCAMALQCFSQFLSGAVRLWPATADGRSPTS